MLELSDADSRLVSAMHRRPGVAHGRLARVGLLLACLEPATPAHAASPVIAQPQRLAATVGQVGEGFGRRVAVSGDTMIVGINAADTIASNGGTASVFVRIRGRWEFAQTLAPADLQSGDFFGWSVALDGDVAVVGAPGDDRIIEAGVVRGAALNRGAAYVFRRNGAGLWALEARIEAAASASLDEFGSRVAIDGDTMAVSAIYHDAPGEPGVPGAPPSIDAGAVWIFRNVSGRWTQEAYLLGTSAYARFGFGLALDAARVLVGSPGAGEARLFARFGTFWGLVSAFPRQPRFYEFREGVGPAARMRSIRGLATLPGGELAVIDAPTDDGRWRLAGITPDGAVRHLAAGLGVDDLGWLGRTLAADGSGAVYVALNRAVARGTSDGGFTVIAGDVLQADMVDGPGPLARFMGIGGIDVDDRGWVFVGDRTAVRIITPDGVVSTLAGTDAVGFRDGLGPAARFTTISSIAVAPDRSVYVVDSYTIRRVSVDGTVTTIAGVRNADAYADGLGSDARIASLGPGLDVDGDGNLMMVDGDRLRKVTPTGLVTTIVPSGTLVLGLPKDGPIGGPGFLPAISAGSQLLISGSDMYLADSWTVRRLRDGVITTIAGVSPFAYQRGGESLYGYDVALRGNRAVVTAPRAYPPQTVQTSAGIAWVFDPDGLSWSPGTPVWAADAAPTERVGESVGLTASGDVVLGSANGCSWAFVGGCVDDSAPTPLATAVTPARIFRQRGGRWTEIASLAPSSLVPRGGFGAAVAIDRSALVLGEPGSGLHPTATAGAAYVFDLATLDLDGDTLPDEWEMAFGLDPASASGRDGPDGDPDGDGLGNAAEHAAHSHPTGLASATRYLAEGATGFFETRISIANPGNLDARVNLRFLLGDGTLLAHALIVPPRQSRQVPVSTLDDMRRTEFSTVIESDAPVIVDRQMWWDAATAYGSSAERSVESPAMSWYFAEGATHSGFELFYLIQNPSDTDAEVLARYLLPSGGPLEKLYSIPGHSRSNIWVNLEEFPSGSGIRALAATDVAAVVTATNHVPIIVERAMYWTRNGTLFEAGHESAGVSAPALRWFFAEGATGPFFDTFVLLANPSPSVDARVRATYLLPSGDTLSKDYTVPANGRANIWLDHEAFPGGAGGSTTALADTAVSVVLDVLNAVPIVAERSMWWPGPTAATWTEAHNTFGSTRTATTWGFAEGAVLGAPTNTDTFFLIANAGTSAGRVRVTLLFDDGGAPVAREYDLPASSRLNVPVRLEFPEAVNRGFGAVVESLGPTAAPLVVERSMYNDARGRFWAAGSAALGTPLP